MVSARSPIVHGNSPKTDDGQGKRMDAADGWDLKPVRAETDGKDAKLGYDSDDPAPGSLMTPGGEDAGDFDYRISKWKGDGQEARHGKA